MILQILLSFSVVLSIIQNTFADAAKCTKMDDRSDSQLTTFRKELLCTYDKEAPPINSTFENRVGVNVKLRRYRINYIGDSPEWANIDKFNVVENSPNTVLISAYVFLTWTDQRLRWDENVHNKTAQITFDRSEIWTPNIEAFQRTEAIFGLSDGLIMSFSWVHMIANCRPISFAWGDQRECILSFRVEPEDKVKLNRYEYDEHVSNSATWSIVKASRIFPLKEGEENEDFVKINKQMPWKYGLTYFETKLVIQKNFAIQDAVIFAPAVVLLILLISSTCIPAKQAARIAMLSIIVIMLVFMFQQACREMPFSPGRIVDIVSLYHNMITCSGAAILEWLVAFIIANKRELSTGIASRNVVLTSSVFSSLKTILVITENESGHINTSRLLDRITFLFLIVISFTLVVLQGKRPPSRPFERGELHDV